jgi:hypothetical protein
MGVEVSWGWLTGGREVEAGRLSVDGGVAGGAVQPVSVSRVIISDKMVFLIPARQSGRAGYYAEKFRSQPRAWLRPEGLLNIRLWRPWVMVSP